MQILLRYPGVTLHVQAMELGDDVPDARVRHVRNEPVEEFAHLLVVESAAFGGVELIPHCLEGRGITAHTVSKRRYATVHGAAARRGARILRCLHTLSNFGHQLVKCDLAIAIHVKLHGIVENVSWGCSRHELLQQCTELATIERTVVVAVILCEHVRQPLAISLQECVETLEEVRLRGRLDATVAAKPASEYKTLVAPLRIRWPQVQKSAASIKQIS